MGVGRPTPKSTHCLPPPNNDGGSFFRGESWGPASSFQQFWRWGCVDFMTSHAAENSANNYSLFLSTVLCWWCGNHFQRWRSRSMLLSGSQGDGVFRLYFLLTFLPRQASPGLFVLWATKTSGEEEPVIMASFLSSQFVHHLIALCLLPHPLPQTVLAKGPRRPHCQLGDFFGVCEFCCGQLWV